MNADDFLTTLQAIMRQILERNGGLDEAFVLGLLEEGYREDHIEHALTLLYNILITSRFDSADTSRAIRVFLPEEEAALGGALIQRLQHLQFAGLASSVEIETLIQAWQEASAVDGVDEDEEFWNIVYHFREDLYWYLKFLDGESISSEGLN